MIGRVSEIADSWQIVMVHNIEFSNCKPIEQEIVNPEDL
jgi:hypothetical protein